MNFFKRKKAITLDELNKFHEHVLEEAWTFDMFNSLMKDYPSIVVLEDNEGGNDFYYKCNYLPKVNPNNLSPKTVWYCSECLTQKKSKFHTCDNCGASPSNYDEP